MMQSILKLFILGLLLLSFTFLFAKDDGLSGTVRGTVTTSDGNTAELVTVYIDGTKRSTLTDAKGRFIFRNVENGKHVLKITLVGYDNIEKDIEVNNNETVIGNLQLKISSVQLAEVTVKAGNKRPYNPVSDYVSKIPLKNIENPQVYSSIDKTVLENQMLYTVDDALRNVTGLQKMWNATNRAGDGGAYVNLRGFIANNSLRNGFVAPVTTSIDAINIEKFEVLKGPSATLFGSNITSYGGVINRVTKKPYESFGGNVSLIGGSYNFYRAQADINTPLTKDQKLMFRVNGAYTNEGTFQDKDAKNKYVAIAPSLTYKFNDKLEINLEYENFYTKASPDQMFFYLSPALGANMNNVEKLGLDYKKSYRASDLYTTSKVSNVFGQVNYKINDHIRSSTNINTAYSYSDGFNPYFYISTNSTGEVGVIRADQSTVGSTQKYFQAQQNFNLDFNIGSMRNRTVAGFDYLKTTQNQTFIYTAFDWVPFSGGDYSSMNANTLAATYSVLKNTPGYDFSANNTYINKGVLNTYSGYIADVLTLVKGLNLMASVRYESNSAKQGQLGQNTTNPYTQGAWSPKFGLVYEILKDKVSVFGNYQNSFKSNGYIVTDSLLTTELSKPEKANQWEGGFKTSLLKGRVNATVSYYNINVKNSLVTVGYLGTNTLQAQSGELVSKGVELEVNAYLVKGFSLIGGLSYNDSKYTEASADVEGRRPATASSPWLANFNASYQFLSGGLKGLGFGIGGNYASDSKIVNSVSSGVFSLPSYFILNANAYYDIKKFRIGVKADNFTNKHYWVGYTTANPQKLINVLGSIAYKF